MYISIAVLISREVEGPEAEEFDLEPGTPRDARLVEEELERLLAPYSYETELIVRNTRDETWWKTVPNYGARFDSWDLDHDVLEHAWDRFIGLSVEDRIYSGTYSGEEYPGFPVFRASELPLEYPYGGVVTPDGRYHELWIGEGERKRELAEGLLKEHGNCLAVLCTAHV
jgi:hypothetical protein